uniref:Zinc finger CCCH domain-containing protein 2-like n=1 Tax=Elaeis guineensis var. tenera TaxID=51953 RepID=A0A8N4F4H8_ELAGV|nr:zinc finger CCCH domain-containing protein 2-like [Elaeis guineensis]
MPTVCTEQHQQQLLYYGKSALLDLDAPPRKLLHRPGLTIYVPDDDQDRESKQELDEEQEGEEEQEEEVDTYSCDDFRMHEFKVRRCMRGRRPNFRRSGACPRRDACEWAHGVSECWLHPARYRTMPCKDSRRCRRKVCFFAHSPRQFRLLPSLATANATTPIPSPGSLRKPSSCAIWPTASSPTSTLRGFSPPLFPPIPPSGRPLQPSRCTTAGNNNNKNTITASSTYKGCGVLFYSGVMGYDSLYEDLMSSLEAMERSGAIAAAIGINGNSGRSSSSFSTSSFTGQMEEKDLVERQRSDSSGLDQEWSVES